MARKSNNRMRQARRDASAIATRSRVPVPFVPPRSGPVMLDLEDRRRFSPGVRQPRTPRQVARLLSLTKSTKARSRGVRTGPDLLAFKIPATTLICVRRRVRKQVMHAKGKAGRKVRPPRRGFWSSISCKR